MFLEVLRCRCNKPYNQFGKLYETNVSYLYDPEKYSDPGRACSRRTRAAAASPAESRLRWAGRSAGASCCTDAKAKFQALAPASSLSSEKNPAAPAPANPCRCAKSSQWVPVDIGFISIDRLNVLAPRCGAHDTFHRSRPWRRIVMLRQVTGIGQPQNKPESSHAWPSSTREISKLITMGQSSAS